MPRRGQTTPTALGHAADFIIFRLMGAAIIGHEIVPKQPADWKVLVAGFACFFMPDALRGRSSLVFMLLARFLRVDNRQGTYDPPEGGDTR